MLMSLSHWPQRRPPNTTGSRTAPKPFLTDAQWDLIKDLFANPPPSPAAFDHDLRAILAAALGLPCDRRSVFGFDGYPRRIGTNVMSHAQT